jgi:hypothetical protein
LYETGPLDTNKAAKRREFAGLFAPVLQAKVAAQIWFISQD